MILLVMSLVFIVFRVANYCDDRKLPNRVTMEFIYENTCNSKWIN